MRMIPEIEQEIRDLINSPRTRFQLMREPAAFGKLCSSLDVVGDTELALDAYLDGDEDATYGQKYLFVYGVLQALFIQQDAVRHLCEALRIEVENEPSLKRVRDTRNDASGHPTQRRSGKGATFHQISRVSITQNDFDLMTTGASGESRISNVDVPELIGVQRGTIERILSEVLEKLKKEEMDHRKNYRDDKLIEKLPKSLGHTCEKIAEATRGGLPPQSGERFVNSMMESIAAFESALDSRGILQAYEDSIGPVVWEAKYALGELRNYFVDGSESKLNSEDASIYLYFIRSKIEDLITMAKELDEEYATDL